MMNRKTYKYEDLFQDIPNDPDNILMTIPEEVLSKSDINIGDFVDITFHDSVMMIKKITPDIRKDRLNRDLHIGDYVWFSQGNDLKFGVIDKFTPDRVSIVKYDYKKISKLEKFNVSDVCTRRSNNVVKIDDKHVTYLTLKSN
jgi:hypothetical protein